MFGQEQTPVLCSECLGPAHAALDGTVTCGYCRHVGRLPDDQLQRAMELSRRVRQAAVSVAQLEGTERALGHIYESRWAFVRVAGPFAVAAVFFLVQAVISSWDGIANAPPNLRPMLIVNAAFGPIMIGGLAVSLCLALAIARRGYRRNVRPLLFARAPQQPGLPARCRACGAPLHDPNAHHDTRADRGAIDACRYCGTQNLVTAELERDRSRLLEQERRFHANRGHQIIGATARKMPNTQYIFVGSCIAVYLVLMGLAYATQSTLS